MASCKPVIRPCSAVRRPQAAPEDEEALQQAARHAVTELIGRPVAKKGQMLFDLFLVEVGRASDRVYLQ
jgi:hypothetical protein